MSQHLRFSLSSLKNFLNYISKMNTVTSFESWNNDNSIILRHDVDLSLRMAYNVFKLEKDIGIKSTFFVLLSSPSYNILSNSNREILREMISSGFEIGLHFDPKLYLGKGKELSIHVKQEASILSDIIGKNVKSISFHNPSISSITFVESDLINAYDEKFFGDEKYFSDSCMDFRGKNPYSFVDNSNKKTSLQILLHPEFYGDQEYTFTEMLSVHLNSEIQELNNTYLVNKKYISEGGNKKNLEFKIRSLLN